MKARRARQAAAVAALAVVYVVVARLGLKLDAVGGFATLVWAPTGISFAALLLLGRWAWPGVALGALAVNLWAGAPPLVALGIAAGNTAEALIGAIVAGRVLRIQPSLDRVRDVVVLVVAVAAGSTAVSATVGVTSLVLGGVVPAARFGEAWSAWWVGDAIGALVVSPLLLSWFCLPRPSLPPARVVEAAASMVALAAISALVLAGWPVDLTRVAPAYAVFPVLIWIAVRFRVRGATAAILVVSSIAIAGAVTRQGPFVRGTLHESLLALQTFMTVVAATILVLASAVAERESAQRIARQREDELRAAHAALERRVHERTAEIADANATLRRREAQLAEAQGIAHVGSWEWDIRANRITWSDELYRIYGVDAGSFAASFEAYLERLHPDDRQRASGLVQGALSDHQAFGFEHRVVRPTGEVRVLWGEGRVVLDEQGAPARMTGIAHDITERKQAEDAHVRLAEAQAAIRARDELMSVAAHELRTPLTPLMLQLQGVRSAVARAGDTRLQDRLDKAVKAGTRLASLVESLLDLSRLANRGIDLERAPVDLGDVARELVERFGEEAARAGCELKLQAADGIVGSWDRLRLEQILTNLLSNAIKYGRDRPIEVSATGDDETGRLVVRDHGIGIAPEDLARIFSRFERAVSTREYGGLGLGLYIARQLVEAHGGRIEAASQPGQGATFTVTLPRAAQGATA